MTRDRRLLVLLSGFSLYGGIQRHNLTLCKVLAAYAEGRGANLELLSLHDSAKQPDKWFPSAPVVGCNGSKALFVTRVLKALATPYDMVIVAHPDFAPLVVLPHLCQPRSPVLVLTYGIEVWNRLPLHKRIALHNADRIWTISDYTAVKLVTEQRVDREKIDVIPVPLAPDFAEVSARQTVARQSTRSRLLTISRLNGADAGKGIDCVISALPEVRSRVPDVTYVVIGDGDDRQRLESLAVSHDVSDIVRFVGRVPDPELHAHLSGTDLFVLPSRKEGFGIVFLEAMAYGKPVIAGAHGGSPEVVVDGETGMLVKHHDQAGLVAAMTSLLRDAGQRQAMGDAGFRRVQSVYSYHAFHTSVTNALNEMLEG